MEARTQRLAAGVGASSWTLKGAAVESPSPVDGPRDGFLSHCGLRRSRRYCSAPQGADDPASLGAYSAQVVQQFWRRPSSGSGRSDDATAGCPTGSTSGSPKRSALRRRAVEPICAGPVRVYPGSACYRVCYRRVLRRGGGDRS